VELNATPTDAAERSAWSRPALPRGALMFGVGGLSLLLVPALTATYAGRYTVPMVGPPAAISAIAVLERRASCASAVGSVKRKALREGRHDLRFNDSTSWLRLTA
jgi:hypothetical protein